MTTITDIRTIAVTVTDQDAALRFYTETVGFEVRLDAPISDTMRWIEVAPTSATTSIALVAPSETNTPGVDTGIRFSVPNAAAEHATLQARGVAVGDLLVWDDVPPMFSFDDPDGNRFYIVEHVEW